jgi:signal transduction histidine kinase
VRTLTGKVVAAIIIMFAASNIIFLIFGGTIARLFIEWANIPRQGVLFISLGAIILILIFLILFALFIHKSIVSRIQDLNEAVGGVVKGDYTVSVPEEGIDEIAKLTQNFNKMTAELRANEFLSKEFARNVSHEFKTPLSVIHGYAELLEARAADGDSAEKLRIIIGEAARLSAMSKSLLEISALDSFAIIRREDVFSPAAQIREILQSSQVLWQTKKIALELDLEDFSIKSNEQLLYRVWQNLISNAIKFTDEDGRITMTLKETENGLIFEISDTGAGIAEADKERIFSQFFVGDRSRNAEGSGLGLPLVRKITEKLGGYVRFESEAGNRTIFTVELAAEIKK